MATLIRELWGASPAFLKQRRTKTLRQLLDPLVVEYSGLKVVPKKWHDARLKDSYWTITRIDKDNSLKLWKAFGVRTYKGVIDESPKEILYAETTDWRFYVSPQTLSTIKSKLGIKSK